MGLTASWSGPPGGGGRAHPADVPYEEKEEFAAPCRAHGLDLISLIAPTSQQRTAAIAREAEGFLCLTAQMDEAQPQADLISGLAP